MSTSGQKMHSPDAAEGPVESPAVPLLGSSNRDDIWDDSIIIKKYDSSLALIKEEVARRLAMSTNRKGLATPPGCSTNRKYQKMETDSVGEAAGGSPAHEEKGTREISEQDRANGLPGTFEIGDYVRATYDDGVDYEAKIIGFGSHGDCLIRYVGYNNEQSVLPDELLPSWGRKARRQQRAEAAEVAEAAKTPAGDSQMDLSDDERFTKQASKIKINFGPNFGRANSGLSTAGGMGMGVRSGMMGACGSAAYMVPPPPPMPPMLEDADDVESENLSAMLMSWYMSGYYTGLYHGQRMSQQQQHQQQSQQAQQQKRARQS